MNPQEISTLERDLSAFLTKSDLKFDEFQTRIAQVEQMLTHPTGSGDGGTFQKSLGEVACDSPQMKSFYENRLSRSGKVLVGDIFGMKTAIVSSGNLFSPAQRVPGVTAVSQALRLRDLLRVSPATSNAVEFVREVPGSTTNAAAPQGLGSSPFTAENVAKPESAIGFELISMPIQTIAHWIPASRQVADDSSALRTFLNSRMLYFLKIVEEAELLGGTGTGGHLKGLATSATAYDVAADVGGDTKLDKLRRAIEQVQASGFVPNGVVLNAVDYAAVDLIKSSTGEYVASPNPRIAGIPSVWGIPVVLSTKMTAGHFLVGDFMNGCELFDRMEATVEVSREHSDFFIRNMIAVLAELRECLVVYQPDSIRYGAF
jgi:HK97 family phage major capsid protein